MQKWNDFRVLGNFEEFEFWVGNQKSKSARPEASSTRDRRASVLDGIVFYAYEVNYYYVWPVRNQR